MKDTYAHGSSKAFLMKEYGLDAMALVRGIEELMDTKFGITEDDLAAARVEETHSLSKAEAL